MLPQETSYNHFILFLKTWLRQPLSVGAISPSSKALANAMTFGIQNDGRSVIEFGAGTGVFTSAILQSGISPSNLTVFELNEKFIHYLSHTYPDVKIIPSCATLVKTKSPYQLGTTQVVICGLPLMAMPSDMVSKIVSESFDCLDKDGEFRLFTYGHRCPVPKAVLDQLGLKAHRSSLIFRNLPPASVFLLKRSTA